jgi:hypothetical protein
MPRIQALGVFKNLITSSDHKASAEPYASYPLVLQMNGTGTARQFILKAARLSSPGGLGCSQPRVFAATRSGWRRDAPISATLAD